MKQGLATGYFLAVMALSVVPLASGTARAPAAQSPVSAAVPKNTSQAAREAALDAFLSELNRRYVYPEVAKRVSGHLQKERRALLAIEDPRQFAAAVQKAARDITKDLHLSFAHDPDGYARLSAPPAPEAPPPPAERAKSHDNHGFRQVAMLDGNIGLIDLDLMADIGSESGAIAAGAMAFLANADAIVIDLRSNGGGSGRMAQFLASYFFPEDEETLLITNRNRSEGTEVQEWTQVYVPGKRMPDVPLYLLIGPATGSAAEGLAYNLQARKRATLIGQPTAGAAHSGQTLPMAGGFVAFIPSGLTINPITKGNWEGAGVQPDVPATSAVLERTLETIWRAKLQKAAAGSPDADWAAWQLAYLEAKTTPVPLPAQAPEFAGTYGQDRRVLLLGDTLFYRRGQEAMRFLLPLKDGSFAPEGTEPYGPGSRRFRFIRDASGKVTAMEVSIRYQPSAVSKAEYKRT